MYKVFVNNKPIIITNGTFLKEHYINIVIKDKAEITHYVNELLYNNDLKGIVINTEDVNQTWIKFTSFFTTIHAAGGVVKNNEGNYLFIKRNGYWDLAKGKVEHGESLANAALREVEEETGISNLVLLEPLEKTYHVFTHNNNLFLKCTHWYEMFYNGNQTLVPQISEGIVDAQWMTKENILFVVMPNTYSNISQIITGYFKL